MRPSPWIQATVALGLTGLTSLLLVLPLDMDGDGLTTLSEWRHGTAALDEDSDGDGLLDGDEVAAGTRPDRRDSDADGLHDGHERQLGTDPWDPDMDGDGVPDGHEQHVDCLLRPDCDQDGLADGDEVDGYSPLDPDSYDVGLLDAVVKAFEDAGQPPDVDGDHDGIPDSWEDTEGLIDWGPYDPQPGRRDLLVEYLVVEGPESGRFDLDLRPAYDDVAAMFASEGDVHIQWQQTIVQRDSEHRPGFLDTDELGYYREVLEQGIGSDNPYVTSIVLNPQQTQPDLAGDILGAAFLRSMIATVDYGAHVTATFEEADSQGITLTGGTVELSPVVESHILGARPAQVRQLAFASQGVVNLGATQDGVYMVTRQDGTDFRWDWRNDWFTTAPNITTEDGDYLQLRLVDVELDSQQLAATIAHELGHTLGLCHAHEPDCYMDFQPSDISQVAIDSTTMSYTAPPGTLHFLASEWDQARQYIECTPQTPITLLAIGAEQDTFYEAKYEASFLQPVTARACGDLGSLEVQFVPDDGIDRSGTGPGFGWAWIWTLSTVGIGIYAAWAASRPNHGPAADRQTGRQ